MKRENSQLTDPLSKYLPEFANMKVGKEMTVGGKKVYYAVPVEHPVTVRDLFRHTTGLDYAGPNDENGRSGVSKDRDDGRRAAGFFRPRRSHERLASVPLNDEPGTAFRYGYSIDVLGRLVEVLSGKTLDQFFEERIFKPLGMKDTAFYVPRRKVERAWPRSIAEARLRAGGIQKSTRFRAG